MHAVSIWKCNHYFVFFWTGEKHKKKKYEKHFAAAELWTAPVQPAQGIHWLLRDATIQKHAFWAYFLMPCKGCTEYHDKGGGGHCNVICGSKICNLNRIRSSCGNYKTLQKLCCFLLSFFFFCEDAYQRTSRDWRQEVDLQSGLSRTNQRKNHGC